jgi:hypothetical protein
MPRLRDIDQSKAVGAFIKLGGTERATKKNYRMVTMPNGALLSIPSGTLKRGTLGKLLRVAGVSTDEFEGAL